jgi:hypothetical protein
LTLKELYTSVFLPDGQPRFYFQTLKPNHTVQSQKEKKNEDMKEMACKTLVSLWMATNETKAAPIFFHRSPKLNPRAQTHTHHVSTIKQGAKPVTHAASIYFLFFFSHKKMSPAPKSCKGQSTKSRMGATPSRQDSQIETSALFS